MKTLYFAYGSNMVSDRFYSRIPSAKFIGIAKLINMKIIFNKRSEDGSGKANLIESEGDITWGVIYEMDEEDFIILDRLEKGYKRELIHVTTIDKGEIPVETYISTILTDDAFAYDWYKELVVLGAKENNLPEEYTAYLSRLPSKKRP